jgi:hypothetical protein
MGTKDRNCFLSRCGGSHRVLADFVWLVFFHPLRPRLVPASRSLSVQPNVHYGLHPHVPSVVELGNNVGHDGKWVSIQGLFQ